MTSSRLIAVVVVVLIVIIGGVAAYTLTNTKSTQTTTSSNLTTTSSSSSSTTSSASPSASSQYSVEIGSNASIGHYLTNGSGFTLYMFGKDTPSNGTSACNGACANLWPPFYASNLKLPAGLNASSFSTITRSDGSKQTTYNGWPLYYYKPDLHAGSMLGEGYLSGLWYAIPSTMQSSGGQIISGQSYSLGIAYKPSIGIYLTNSSGFSLYYFLKDTPNNGTSACNGSCASLWPAFYASNLKLPPGVNASQIAVINRTDGKQQITYQGRPLYTYAPDLKPGDTNGEGALGLWYAFSLPTPKITSSSTTTTSTTAATSTSSSSYAGYGY